MAGSDLRAAGYVATDTSRDSGSPRAGAEAATAVASFGVDLLGKIATPDDNLVVSPWSIAVALAMTRSGAVGRTGSEMDSVLHGTDLGPGLSWLDQALDDRAGRRENASGHKGDVGLEGANSLWGQRGVTWEPSFLDELARDFGTGMHVVDYRRDPDGVAAQISTWAADRTHGRIKDLVPKGALDELTRLVLVNAIWFKAPWFEPFEPGASRPGPFHLAGGGTVEATMMTNPSASSGFAEGPGWRAASLPYAGEELAMAVVVPQGTATVEDIRRQLGDGGLTRLLGSFESVGGVDVLLPSWTSRTQLSLRDVLVALGMPTAFSDAADFSGMTRDESLQVAKVLHQGYVAVDEKGTEAAAATAVTVRTTSAIVGSDQYAVHADRPFLYVVHDVATRLPLFVGQVADPTA